ncbi:MAG: MaoC family dehydratase [Reyranellaceae bacterium]
MKTVGLGFFWQDINVGERYRTVGRTIFEADLAAFIAVTGMTEVLFNNVEFVKSESAIKGGRPVPGALVYSFAEGLLVQSTMQGTGLAFLGCHLDVKGPTFVGDTIHVDFEITELRRTSKGNRAIVQTRNEVKNQRGETVLLYDPKRMMKGRD